VFLYELGHFNVRKAHRGGDSNQAKELVVAPTQISAANTVRVNRNTLCCTVFGPSTGLVRDYRIHWDVSPVIVVGGGRAGVSEAAGR
jgi:hypothetical protein